MLIQTEGGTPKHINPVTYVDKVPSKRDAEAAYCRMLSALTYHQVDVLEADIEMVRSFLWSR